MSDAEMKGHVADMLEFIRAYRKARRDEVVELLAMCGVAWSPPPVKRMQHARRVEAPGGGGQ